MNNELNIVPEYYFDIVPERSFLHYWISEYMSGTLKAVRKSGANLTGSTLYDIGLGRGRSLPLFKTLGVKKVVGLDVNADVAGYARNQSNLSQLDLEVILDDLNNTYLKTIPSGSCDAVSLMNILFAFGAKSRKTVLLEAKRIVKPGGVVIIADACKPSLMYLFNSLSLMGRVFSTEEELKKVLSPLELLDTESSNYFYLLNKPADLIGKIFGPTIFTKLNSLMQLFKAPPSTKSFVFRKP